MRIEWILSALGTGALIFVLDSFLLPRFNWYCQLRTLLFRLFPTAGTIAGYRVGPSSSEEWQLGMVLQVDRKFKTVLLDMTVKFKGEDGRDMVWSRQEWRAVSELRWFPWWTEQ